MNIAILFEALSETEKAGMYSISSNWNMKKSYEEAKTISLSENEKLLAKSGSVIEAIKQLRKRLNLNLITAKRAVDHYRDSLT